LAKPSERTRKIDTASNARRNKARREINLQEDTKIYQLIKQTSINTGVELVVVEYMVAYYMYYVAKHMSGPYLPVVKVPYFGKFFPSLKSVRMTLRAYIRNYKQGKMEKNTFIRLFRYQWAIYKMMMDRIYGPYPTMTKPPKMKMTEEIFKMKTDKVYRESVQNKIKEDKLKEFHEKKEIERSKIDEKMDELYKLIKNG